MTNPARPCLVFVSHATRDKFLATILCEKIEALGATTFRDDRDIEGGSPIPGTIVSRIRTCDELVVLLTPDSVDRQWINFEMGIAVGAERRVVPLLYRLEADRLPVTIRELKAHDLDHLDDYLEELARRVRNR